MCDHIHPIALAIVHCLEASHVSHLHSREGITKGWEHREVGIVRATLESVCPKWKRSKTLSC